MQKSSPHDPVSSKDNSFVKHLRSLSEAKYRKKEKAFLIEGIKMVEEAIREDLGARLVIAEPSLTRHHGKGIIKLAESRNIPILWISERIMDTLSENKTPQPVMAEMKIKQHSEEELLANSAGLIVIAHRLQDPGNLGTIIRTAEAVGASGVAVTSNTVDPYNAKTIRASMGSILRLPVIQCGNVTEFIETCKRRGFQTVGTILTGDKTHFDVDFRKRTAVILGQEGAGLPQDITAAIDLRVRIPMAPAIDSLNVGTAAAVILYEATRQKMMNPPKIS